MKYKALSLWPVYADEIMCGEKTIEYRSWQTPYRGDLLICASSKNNGKTFVRGHALGVVELYKITGEPKNYEWHLRNPRFIDPVPVKGKLHLFDVEIEDEDNLPTVCDYWDVCEVWISLGLV